MGKGRGYESGTSKKSKYVSWGPFEFSPCYAKSEMQETGILKQNGGKGLLVLKYNIEYRL